MPKFTKKPVEVEARQFPREGESQDASKAMDIYHWIESLTIGSFEPMAVIVGDAPAPASGVSIDPRDGRMIIATLKGLRWVNPGDWVIRGVAGEFYPCKPDIFDATYETVGGDE